MDYLNANNMSQEYHPVDFVTTDRTNQKNRVCERRFGAVEEQAFEDLGSKQERISQLDKDQYSFNMKPNPLPYPRYIYPHNYGTHEKFPENKVILQLRSGAVYNTVRENCYNEFKTFFKYAGQNNQ